ncbi:MAG: calcium-binding protein [Cyanobacteria bacterium P01_D01_bin.6]
MATIRGTDREDYLVGTSEDDEIYGEGRNDRLLGLGGNDHIFGGYGNDTFYGEAGNDKFYGDIGFDLLSIDIETSTQNSRIALSDNQFNGASNGFGTDTLDSIEWVQLIGSSRNIYNRVSASFFTGKLEFIGKSFFGYSPRNTVFAGSGDDALLGAGNDDYFSGGSGADLLRGHGGNDRLIGGAGRDHLEGGEGDDIYIIADSSDRLDKIIERADEGNDTIETSVSHGLRSGVNDQVENLTLKGTVGIDGTGNYLNNVIRGNRGSNRLIGGSGNDTLLGEGGNDVLVGPNPYRLGTPITEIDVLTGGGGNDEFVLGLGGPGSRNWIGGSHPQYLYDDGTRRSGGSRSYGLIIDFTDGMDKIQLRGVAQEYKLKPITVTLNSQMISGTGIYLDEYSTFPDELIGVVQHGQGIQAGQLELTNTQQFFYV